MRRLQRSRRIVQDYLRQKEAEEEAAREGVADSDRGCRLGKTRLGDWLLRKCGCVVDVTARRLCEEE